MCAPGLLLWWTIDLRALNYLYSMGAWHINKSFKTCTINIGAHLIGYSVILLVCENYNFYT
jgi:hypothetical protein